MKRRSLLRNMALLAAGTAFANITSLPAFAQGQVMRLFWWGTPSRAERTLGVAKLFEASHEGVKINGEVGGNDYWPKLTTMIAGGNAPDIFQLEPNRFADYSRRGTTLVLNDYIGSVIKTDKLVPGVLELGTVDGKVTGIPLSINAFAMFYDTDVFQKTGIAAPTAKTTWEEFAKMCVDLTKAIGEKNVWAVSNCSRYMHAFQAWLVQRGKGLFNAEGKLGFDEADATEWYRYWSELAKAGGCVDAEVQALDKVVVDSSPLATGNAVITIGFSNQLPAYQGVRKTPLEIVTLPLLNETAPSGLFYRPGLHWSIASTSKNPELAAQFIDTFINDPEAGKILEVERGVPVNTDIQALVTPGLDPVAKKTVDYINAIEGIVGTYPPPVPMGAAEFEERAFRPTADKVAFGQLTPEEGAKELIAQGARILKG